MTINCQKIELELDGLLDRTLPLSLAEEMYAHLRQCPDCKLLLEKETRLRALLAGQKVPPMREGFAKQAFSASRTQNENQNHHNASAIKHRLNGNRSFFAGFSYALATVAIVWFGVTQFYTAKQSSDPIQTVSMNIGEVKKVHLVFNSSEAMDVTVAIKLPEYMELQGHSGVSNMEWKTALKKGKNIITLPVVAQLEKNGEIITRISSGNKGKIFKVRLNVNSRRSPILDKAFFKIDSQPKGVLI
jgi:hypothetical protein